MGSVQYEVMNVQWEVLINEDENCVLIEVGYAQ